jgi:hypothetical protein
MSKRACESFTPRCTKLTQGWSPGWTRRASTWLLRILSGRWWKQCAVDWWRKDNLAKAGGLADPAPLVERAKAKPSDAKGGYPKKVSLLATMGPGARQQRSCLAVWPNARDMPQWNRGLRDAGLITAEVPWPALPQVLRKGLVAGYKSWAARTIQSGCAGIVCRRAWPPRVMQPIDTAFWRAFARACTSGAWKAA